MQIGIIGAGRVGLSVARASLKAGHHVLIAGRERTRELEEKIEALGAGAVIGSISEAVAADLTFLAVPWTSVKDVLSKVPDWAGHILVDVTNPYKTLRPQRVLEDLGDRIASVIVAEHAPGARVVKALNSISMDNFNAETAIGNFKRVLFIAGDFKDAKDILKGLLEDFGFAVIDIGGLAVSRILQSGNPLAGRALFLAS
jgi:8-hydroxy-5-deazaflavin:NADPH oxidoreductase